MTPEALSLVIAAAAFILGFVARMIFEPRDHVMLPPPSRPAPPMPGVQPTRPWPTQLVYERHVQHAIDALTDRSMNTDVSIEDALDSAERFINAARGARRNQPESEECRARPHMPQPESEK